MLAFEVATILLCVAFAAALFGLIARKLLNPEKIAFTDLPSIRFYFEWGAPYCLRQIGIYVPFIVALWIVYYLAPAKAVLWVLLIAIVSSLASAASSMKAVTNLLIRDRSFEPSYFALGLVSVICLAIVWRFIDNIFVVTVGEGGRLRMGWAIIIFYPTICGISISALLCKLRPNIERN